MRKIVLLPFYNEAAALGKVLENLEKAADLIIAVNDGSTDRSAEIFNAWAKGRAKALYVGLDRNRGKSHALKKGFEKIMELHGQGLADEWDLVIITDADNQIPQDIIDRACDRSFKKGKTVIGSRDFSGYPFLKRAGNVFFSAIATVLTGFRFNDSLCGFRVFSVRDLKKMMPCYVAEGYACDQVLSLIAAFLKLGIDNDFPVRLIHFHSNPNFIDALQIARASLITWLKFQV
jgi:glycosyltransferase involved in cell wall biosynthesis